jgi:histidinol phosphatase-like enzyme
MVKLKLLFCNIDDTLTTTNSGHKFKQSSTDVLPLASAVKQIKWYANNDYKIYGVSNQGGCSTINPRTKQPFKTIEDTIAEMQYTLGLFPELDHILFCPAMDGKRLYKVFGTGENDYVDLSALINIFPCGFRKPSKGMALACMSSAIVNYGDNPTSCTDYKNQIDFQLSLFVGDRDEDRECAVNAGIPFLLSNEWYYSDNI